MVVDLIPLVSRGILRLHGSDRKNFLQGLVTQDINLLTAFQSLYTAFLTPQGKFLHDFFIIEDEEDILIETHKSQADLLKKRLLMFKLKNKIDIEDVSSSYKVFSHLGAQEDQRGLTIRFNNTIQFSDPRLKELGSRQIKKINDLEKNVFISQDKNSYEKLCLSLGIPEAGQEMIPEKSIPLEVGLQDLNAISWNKGCYIGQELTARTKYRGEIRKRFFPVTLAAKISDPSQPILMEDLKAGELYSVYENKGIARLRLEYLNKPLTIDGINLHPYHPKWIKI